VALVARSPEKPAGPAAERGSAQHGLMEHLLLEGGYPEEFIGATAFGMTFDKPMVDEVQIAYSDATKMLEPFLDEQFIEQRVVYIEGEVFGTADMIGIGKDMALIADHKFGAIQVKADSYQTRFLAATALKDPEISPFFKKVKTFRLGVIQPAFDPASETVDVSREEIEQFGKTIELTHTLTKSPDAPVRIGEWCKWCPAKPICPAYKTLYNDLIDLRKHDKQWAPQNIAMLLELKPLLEEAQERAKHELANGRPIPGWKLRDGATRQAWNEDDMSVIATLRGLGLKPAQITKAITPAQAKKLVPDKKHDVLDAMITKSQNEPSLVKDTGSKETAVTAKSIERMLQNLKGLR